MAEPALREPAAPAVVIQAPPLTLNRRDALRFTNLAPKIFGALERSGQINGKPWGPHGETVFQRVELEGVVARMFGAGPANDLDDEIAGLDL